MKENTIVIAVIIMILMLVCIIGIVFFKAISL